MKAKLIIVGADIKPGEYKLKLPAVLGRGKEASLKLVHALVSRQHCEIFETEGQLMVRDLGSLNGTFVAGQRIAEAVPLLPGELLTVGSVTFRADYGDDVFLMPPPTDPAFRGKETQQVPRAGRETVNTGEKEHVWADSTDAGAGIEVAEDDFFDFLGDSPAGDAPAADAPPLDTQAETQSSVSSSNRGLQPAEPSPAAEENATSANKKTGTKSVKRPSPEKPKPKPAEAPSHDENPYSPPDPSQQHSGSQPASEDEDWDSFLDGLQ